MRSLEIDRVEMGPIVDLLKSQVQGKEKGRLWKEKERTVRRREREQ